MKFKCVKVEMPTEEFTVGKVYSMPREDNFGFVISDTGRELFISMVALCYWIGTKDIKEGKKTLKNWPQFAYFEKV
jgi:hypothetical protein